MGSWGGSLQCGQQADTGPTHVQRPVFPHVCTHALAVQEQASMWPPEGRPGPQTGVLVRPQLLRDMW